MAENITKLVEGFRIIAISTKERFRKEALSSDQPAQYVIDHYFSYLNPLRELSQGVIDDLSKSLKRDELFAVARALQAIIEDDATSLHGELQASVKT
ncbi:MAG: hypothetical protein EOO08_13075 [Chitinophagaceae bacterium]|nr:MAG: hypothetical protein EOO08_13075 [Chitinophagaceae bacterium]